MLDISAENSFFSSVVACYPRVNTRYSHVNERVRDQNGIVVSLFVIKRFHVWIERMVLNVNAVSRARELRSPVFVWVLYEANLYFIDPVERLSHSVGRDPFTWNGSFDFSTKNSFFHVRNRILSSLLLTFFFFCVNLVESKKRVVYFVEQLCAFKN